MDSICLSGYVPHQAGMKRTAERADLSADDRQTSKLSNIKPTQTPEQIFARNSRKILGYLMSLPSDDGNNKLNRLLPFMELDLDEDYDRGVNNLWRAERAKSPSQPYVIDVPQQVESISYRCRESESKLVSDLVEAIAHSPDDTEKASQYLAVFIKIIEHDSLVKVLLTKDLPPVLFNQAQDELLVRFKLDYPDYHLYALDTLLILDLVKPLGEGKELRPALQLFIDNEVLNRMDLQEDEPAILEHDYIEQESRGMPDDLVARAKGYVRTAIDKYDEEELRYWISSEAEAGPFVTALARERLEHLP